MNFEKIIKKERRLRSKRIAKEKAGNKKAPKIGVFQEAQTGFEPVRTGVADHCLYVRPAAPTLRFYPFSYA